MVVVGELGQSHHKPICTPKSLAQNPRGSGSTPGRAGVGIRAPLGGRALLSSPKLVREASDQVPGLYLPFENSKRGEKGGGKRERKREKSVAEERKVGGGK